MPKTRQVSLKLVLTVLVVGCADGAGVDPADAEAPEVALKDHGFIDAGRTDASECSGPNPTREGDPGSYCSQYCVDVVYAHICRDGIWQCPLPGSLLVRDCGDNFGNRPDVAPHDFGFEDAGDEDVDEPDVTPTD